ncbi:MAG: response regulator transcription factor [Leptolyngbyaceae cyanobacterium bins.59]|nr:response regulator transcription factor [Leptolyngbyaceae cyanobacterium bins.59]
MPIGEISQIPISTLLVDDEPQFRQGLHTLLNFYSNNALLKFVIVGEASTPQQAIHLAVEQHPALILLDIELASQDGITVLEGLQKNACKSKVLVLSGHREDEWVFRAMQAGAVGYLFKEQLPVHLCTAIHTVMSGQIYLSPEVVTGFFHLFHFYVGRSKEAKHDLHLTEREAEVLHWLVQGASNEEIAARLNITVATVKAHLTAIFMKLSVTSRTQAIIKALKLGLVAG